jgi:UDPglucose 6-dehydrogenase
MIGVIGVGMVGGAIIKSLKCKNIKFSCYDKYKNIGNLEKCLETKILFLCLPTLFDEKSKSYNKNSILETVKYLQENNYKGLIVLKSTVEPGTSQKLSDKFKNLKIFHNPEFLTARTAFEDFENQNHVVLGKTSRIGNDEIQPLYDFFKNNYCDNISVVSSGESEMMKITSNSFYSVKIQFFTEIYLLCQKLNISYENVKDLILKNGWVNKMHTQVPGHDGKVSYGGECFPKDSNALLSFMKDNIEYYSILDSTVNERNKLRN